MKTKIKNIINLEVGKRYLNRLGEVVKIVGKKDPLYIYYPYISDRGKDYQSNGIWLSEYGSMEDLIEEVPMQTKEETK